MIRSTKCISAFLVAFAVCLGQAQESEVDKLRAELTEVKDQVQSMANRLAKGVQIHGFLSQGWMRSTDNNYLTESDRGSADYNEFGLNFATRLSDSLHVGIQLFARELGDSTTNGVVIDWGYADYAYRDWLGLRVGRVKRPLGLYGESRDIDAARVQILLPQAVYDERLRDVLVSTDGISLYGTTSLGFFGNLDYVAWYGGFIIDPEGGVDKSFESNGEFEVEDIEVKNNSGGYLSWETPLDGLRFVQSFSRTNNMDVYMRTTGKDGALPASQPVTGELGRVDMAVSGMEYALGDWVFAAEYFTQRSRSDYTIDLTGAGGPIIRSRRSRYLEGYYGGFTWQATDRLALASSYGVFYNDASDKDGSELTNPWERWQKDLSIGAKYDISPNWIVKAEYHFMNGTGLMYASDNPQGVTEDWQMIIFKLTYSF